MEWKPTDVTILFVYCWISTCFRPTGPSSGEFVQLFTQPLVQCLCRSVRVLCMLWPVLVNIFYSYIAGSLHVSGPPAHLQESSYSCSDNHWFSICTALFACSVTYRAREQSGTETVRTNGCVNSCTNSPEDGPVGPKHVEIQQYTNKIVTSVGFHSICWNDASYKKLKIIRFICKLNPPITYSRMRFHPMMNAVNSPTQT